MLVAGPSVTKRTRGKGKYTQLHRVWTKHEYNSFQPRSAHREKLCVSQKRFVESARRLIIEQYQAIIIFAWNAHPYRLYTSHPQIWPTPAEFSSNPNQTHLSMLISVFKFIRKSQVGEFDQGWSQTLQQIEPGKEVLCYTHYLWRAIIRKT